VRGVCGARVHARGRDRAGSSGITKAVDDPDPGRRCYEDDVQTRKTVRVLVRAGARPGHGVVVHAHARGDGDDGSLAGAVTEVYYYCLGCPRPRSRHKMAHVALHAHDAAG
jgi:hypothetical protein